MAGGLLYFKNRSSNPKNELGNEPYRIRLKYKLVNPSITADIKALD